MTQRIELAMSQVPMVAQKIINILDGASIWLGKAASWIAVPMVLSLIYEVVSRYVFNMPTIWAMDVAMILFGIHFMLGSPYCLQTGGHIRTDFFYQFWRPKTKGMSDFIQYIILFFPAHILFLILSWNYFLKSFLQNEVSVTSPWMPIIWPAKLAIPVCVFFTILQGISECMKNYYRWKTNTDLWSSGHHIVEK